MWDLSGSEIEPASSALAGEFFTIEPPGKPTHFLFKVSNITSVRELIQKNKIYFEDSVVSEIRNQALGFIVRM